MTKIQIGQKVKWICKPYSLPSFECEGIVLKIEKLNPGGKYGKEKLMVL